MNRAEVATDAGTIAYRSSSGGGRPLIFVHGNSSSSRTWGPQLDGPLGHRYRCIALDLPGHGESSPLGSSEEYHLPAYAEAVRAVSEEVGASHPVLVGWSLGGHIALETLTVMDDIAGVVMFGTPPLSIPPAMAEAFLPNPAMAVGFAPEVSLEDARTYATAFFAPGAGIDLEPFVADIMATDGAARVGLGASVGAVNYADEVDIMTGMTQPLAILHGAGEQLVSGAYLERIEAPTLWRGAVQYVDGAGHAPHQEAPEEFNDLVDESVQDLA